MDPEISFGYRKTRKSINTLSTELQWAYHRRLSQLTLAKYVCNKVVFYRFMIYLAGAEQ